jgi:ketosteroid isomerase-like protein
MWCSGSGAGNRSKVLFAVEPVSRNVEAVRWTYELINRSDVDGWLATLHPDCVFRDPTRPNLSDPEGLYRGREGARSYWEDWEDVWDGMRVRIEEVIEAGDRLVVRIRAKARGTRSRIELENVRHHVMTMREGKVIRFEHFEDRADALDAAGLCTE